MLRRLARFSAVLIAVLALAGITFMGATLSAAGSTFKSTTTVSISAHVKLASSNFGPGANVTITYSCFPGFGGKGGYGGNGFGSVTLTDLNGNQGFTSFGPTCDDTKHSLSLFVMAQPAPSA